MMNRVCKACLIAAFAMLGAEGRLLAQAPGSSPVPGCEDSHKVLTPKMPRMGADGNIVPGQTIVQLKLTLAEGTLIRVVENPRTGKDLDTYNSTIIVQRGEERKAYALGRLIKYGSSLRLVETASFCSSPDKKTLFLAFETPSVGAAEGFAVIQYSSGGIDVQVLPMADQGRIVVSKADLSKVELWSAKGSASKIDCDACKKHYEVQDCGVGEHSVRCSPRAGVDEIRSPAKFIGARIEVR
jgi:hypothetical protein